MLRRRATPRGTYTDSCRTLLGSQAPFLRYHWNECEQFIGNRYYPLTRRGLAYVAAGDGPAVNRSRDFLLRLPREREVVTMHVDPDVVAWYRAQGEQWEARMRAALRIYVEAHKE